MLGRQQLHQFYRFNFQDNSILNEHRDKFYGVAVNANTVAYASYRVKELLHTINKPFFVDPLTYFFALPLVTRKNKAQDKKDEEELKLSYRILAAYYSGPFLERLKPAPVYTKLFTRAESVDNAAQKVISFQRFLPGSLSSIRRYQRFLKRKRISEELSPAFLVTPYFHFNSVQDPWYGVSLQLALSAMKYRADLPLFALLCFSRACLLTPPEHEQIIRDYRNFDGFLIWIPGFKDSRASYGLLSALAHFVKRISTYNKPTILLHSGYYGALLSKVGLTGFSSGLCYGDSKLLQLGGGRLPAPVKFYLPEIHALRLPDEAAGFYNSTKNARLLCRCHVCKRVRERLGFDLGQADSPVVVGKFFTDISLEEAQGHFMEYRAKEVTMLENETREEAIVRIGRELDFIENDMLPPPETTMSNHLRRWKLALV